MPARLEARWTPEEDDVLLNAWKASIGPSGQAPAGFFKEVHKLFPHRTFWAVKNRAPALVNKGLIQRQRQRAKYFKLDLSDSDKGWLAGILDGEGSIRQIKAIVRNGCKNGINIQVIPCYNTDLAVIEKVSRLVPHATVKRRLPQKNLFGGKRDIYHVILSGYEPILDYLVCVLPYMAHTEKRIRANRIIEFIKGRLNC